MDFTSVYVDDKSATALPSWERVVRAANREKGSSIAVLTPLLASLKATLSLKGRG